MYIIIEHNGTWIIGLALDNKGIVRTFKFEDKAKSWASKNCAFSYKIVKI